MGTGYGGPFRYDSGCLITCIVLYTRPLMGVVDDELICFSRGGVNFQILELTIRGPPQNV